MSAKQSNIGEELSMDEVFLNNIRDYVLRNISSEEFSLESLSSEIGYSRSQIHRKLKRITGKSLSTFVREFRLEEANRLLKIKAGTVSDIAYRTGFSSPAYFNKCFTDHYGITPGEAWKQDIQKRSNIPEKPYSLWQELKRRKVFKVITMYAAAAYVIIELSNNIVEPLRLPEWVPTFIIILLATGFPFAVIFSWIFDVTPEGIQKTKPARVAREDEPVLKPVKRKLRVSDIVIAVLLIAVIVLVYPKIFKPDRLEQLRSEDEIAIAVMPFVNMTGDTTWNIWQAGIQDELISYLTNSEDLKVRQTSTVNNILQGKDPVNWASLTPSAAGNISQKLNAEIFIYGTIKPSGEKIRVNAQLVDSKTLDIFKSFEIDGRASEEMILPVIDSLKRKVCDYLILNKLLSMERDPVRKFYHSTSPEAYRYWTYGDNAFRKQDYPMARQWFLRALEADSNYTYAALRIAYSYANEDLYKEKKKWCLKLYSKRDSVPIVMKLNIENIYAWTFGTPEENIFNYSQLIEIDNQSHGAQNQLGFCYWILYQYDKAIPALEKSIELCDKFGIKPYWIYYYTILGEAYHKTGEYRKEKKLYNKAEKDFPGDPQLLHNQAVLALSTGKTKAADEYIKQYRSVLEENSVPEKVISTRLGRIYWKSELLNEAEDYFRESFTLGPPNILRMNDLAYFFDLAYFLIDSERNINEGLELAEKQLETYPDNYNYLHTMGWGLYKQGNYREALNILQKSWDLRRENAIYDHEAFLHLEAAKKAVANQIRE